MFGLNELSKSSDKSLGKTILKGLIAAIVPVVAILGALFIFLASREFADANSDSRLPEWWVYLLSDLGQALLGGGVLALLLNSAQFYGVYKTAMSEVMANEAYLKKRNDLERIWKSVTGFLTDQKFPDLVEDVHTDVLGKYLPREKEDYYYENYKRVSIVEWDDEEPDRLKVTEEIELDIVPATASKNIKYVYQFSQSSGSGALPDCSIDLSHEEIAIDDVIYIKDNKEVADFVEQATVHSDPGKNECIITLEGKERYRLRRRTIRKFNPASDPYQRIFSLRFVRNTTIIVKCIPSNVRVRFMSLGTVRDFDRVVKESMEHITRRGDIIRHYPKLLFPRQGYALIFQVLSPEIMAAMSRSVNETVYDAPSGAEFPNPESKTRALDEVDVTAIDNTEAE